MLLSTAREKTYISSPLFMCLHLTLEPLAALEQFMAGPGAALRHRPDIVLVGLDGPGTYCLVDVKTLDAAGATHRHTHHTDRVRLAGHVAIARHSAQSEYGALPPRMRLAILAVSTLGSFGPAAVRFLADLGRRAGSTLPVALLESATWAAPRYAPFVRMALGHAVRRGLAESVLRRWRRVRDPAALHGSLVAPVAIPAAMDDHVAWPPLPAIPGGAVLPAPPPPPALLPAGAAAVGAPGAHVDLAAVAGGLFGT